MSKQLTLALFLCLFGLRVIAIGGFSAYIKDSSLDRLSGIREGLSERIYNMIPGDQGALLSGILIGSQDRFSPELKKRLQNTSTIHIAVVSGQNLSLLVGFIMVLSPLLGRRKTLGFALVVASGYAFLTGFGIATIRAWIMAILTIIAKLFGREGSSFYVLNLAAGVMLLIDPNILLSISFQLSFLATLAVIELSPLIEKRFKFIPDIVRADLSVSLAAQLLTLPVIALNFRSVSILGVLVNTLVLWTILPVMLLGMLALLVSFISQSVASVIVLAPAVLLTFFLYIVNFFNSLSFNLVKLPAHSGLLWIGYYVVILSLWLGLRPKSDSKL